MSFLDAAAPPLDSRADRSTRIWRFAALAVLAPVIVLRFIRPDAVQFSGEQIEAITLAYKSLLEGGASHGLRVSVGVDMPPFFLWLLSLPVLVTRDPMAVTLFVMVANLAGLVGLFLFLRRFVDERVAWLATILAAASPWAIVFARKIWAQDFLFPCVVAFVYAFFALQERYGRVRLWMCLLAFSLLEQLYPSAWFLVPPLAAYLWIFPVRVPRRDLIVGIVIALVPWVPYFAYQASIGFDDLLRAWFLRNVEGLGQSVLARDPWAHFIGPLRLAGGTGFEYLLGEGGMESWRECALVPASLALSGVFLVACVAAIVHAIAWSALRIRDARRGAFVPLQDRVVVFLALFFVGLWLACSALHLPALPHYHIIFLPAVMPLVAWSLLRALRRFGRSQPAYALAAVVPFAVAHEILWVSFVCYVAVFGHKVEGTYGPPYCVMSPKFDAALAGELDELVHGDERRAEYQRHLQARFEASREVLLAFDPVRNTPPIAALGSRLTPGESGGLAIRMQNHPHMVDVPEFEYPVEGHALVMFELTVPVDTILQVFYQTRDVPEYKRGQILEVPVRAGTHSLFVPLDVPGLSGRLRLRTGAYRYVVHALEVRRVDT